MNRPICPAIIEYKGKVYKFVQSVSSYAAKAKVELLSHKRDNLIYVSINGGMPTYYYATNINTFFTVEIRHKQEEPVFLLVGEYEEKRNIGQEILTGLKEINEYKQDVDDYQQAMQIKADPGKIHSMQEVEKIIAMKSLSESVEFWVPRILGCVFILVVVYLIVSNIK